jgi:hypothetical protein
MKRVAHIAWQLLVCAPGMVWLVPTGSALLAYGVVGLFCTTVLSRGAFVVVIGFGLLLMVFSPVFAGGVTVGALARRSATLLAPHGRVHLWLGAIAAQVLLCASIAAVPAALLLALPGLADPLGPGLMFERVFGTALALVSFTYAAVSSLMLASKAMRTGVSWALVPVSAWLVTLSSSSQEPWIFSHSELTLQRCLWITAMWFLLAAVLWLLPRRHSRTAPPSQTDGTVIQTPVTGDLMHFLSYSAPFGVRWVLPLAAVLAICLTLILPLQRYLETGLLGIYCFGVFDSGRRITAQSRQLWLRAGLDRMGVLAVTERAAWRRLLEATVACAGALCWMKARSLSVDVELLWVAGLVASIGIVALYFAQLNPVQSVHRLAFVAQCFLLSVIETVVYLLGTDAVGKGESQLPVVLGLIMFNLTLAAILRIVGQRQWRNIDWLLCRSSTSTFWL